MDAAAFDQDITSWLASGSSFNMFTNATLWLEKYERTPPDGGNGPARAWSLIPEHGDALVWARDVVG